MPKKGKTFKERKEFGISINHHYYEYSTHSNKKSAAEQKAKKITRAEYNRKLRKMNDLG